MANPPYVPGGMKPGVAKTVKPKVVAAPHQAKPAKAAPNPTAGVNSGAGAKPSTGGAGLFGGLGPDEYIRRLYAPQEDAAKNLFGGLDPGDFIAKLFAPQESAVNNMFGGLSPQEYVQQIYAPQLQMLQQQQGVRSGAFAGMVKDFLSSLNNVGEQLQPYTNAASQQTSDANNAAAALAAANPNAVTQNDLAAVNAPQAQRDQVAQQNSTAFGGNAALLRYAGGAIPSDQFRSNAASRAAYLATLPAIGESIGVRGFTALANLASKELGQLSTSEAQTLAEAVQSQGSARVSLASSKAGALSDAVQSAGKLNLQIAGNKASDLTKARTDLASYVQGNQRLKAAAAKTAFDENATITRLNQGQQSINARNRVNAFNQAATRVRLDQSQQSIDLTAQMDAFNRKYKSGQQAISKANLGIRAQEFARGILTSNRNYAVSLANLGIAQRKDQRATIAQEYKLKSGGFTKLQVNKFKASAFNISQNAFNGGGANGPFYKSGPNKDKPIDPVDYKTAIKEMRGAGVPLSIALPQLNQLYKPGVRGRPLEDNGTASYDFGGSPTQLVGNVPKANWRVALGPEGAGGVWRAPWNQSLSSNQRASVARAALKAVDPSLATSRNVTALVGRMNQESGGQTGIVNKWDSNWQKGIPSIGLLQTIGPTFDQYKVHGHGNIWDPLDNSIAAVRYMLANYGRIVGPSRSGY